MLAYRLELTKQIQNEFTRTALTRYQNISHIRFITEDLIIFKADEVAFTARLTQKTGRLKRNSIRIER